MPEPFTTSIATALAAGVAAAVSDGTRALLKRLADLVRERLRKNPSRSASTPDDEATLNSVINGTDDPAQVRRLADLIGERMREDPAFARELQQLWQDLTASTTRNEERITNLVAGDVSGTVVQARDVEGGISIGLPPTGQTPQR